MKFEKIKLKISGMTCDHCAITISKKVSRLNGIVYNSVSYPKKEGEFKFDPQKVTRAEIIEAINSTGHYKVVDEKTESPEVTLPEEDGEFDFDLIIVGGGSAAFAAAIKASELGKRTLMINAGLPIGGTCVNVGCVPSKNLIRAAEKMRILKDPDFPGIYSNGGGLDFQELVAQNGRLVEELREHKYIDVLKDDENVTIIEAYAKVINPTTVEAEGKKYSAKYILIATGAKTFVPDIQGLKDVNYLTNETLYKLDRLPEHLIILGGRYIALENAQLFTRLGSKVTVLQRSLRILPNEMPDVTEMLSEFMNEEGVKIKTGARINSIRSNGNNIVVEALVKDQPQIIEGSHLFVATGRCGNAPGFGLKELGVKMHGRDFVKTNEYLQTTVKNIFAAGDVTGEYLFVYSAAYEGALAVENMFGETPKKKDYSVFPWVIFTDPQLAGVGMDENQASENNVDYEVSIIRLKDVPRSIAARNTKGFIKLIREKNTDKLLGARILAPEGSELLMEISIAIKYGITVKEMKGLFHPYLTLSEGVKLAAIGFEKDVGKLSCCAV